MVAYVKIPLSPFLYCNTLKMKTREQILEQIKNGKTSQCLDGRDMVRLGSFFPVSDWSALGLTLKEGVDPATVTVTELTRENVLAQLKQDLAFGFTKALDQRGISASFMFEVVKMWMWVLDDEELSNFDAYAMYGLPLFKKVAVKYGFDNPIGDDEGSEEIYDCN